MYTPRCYPSGERVEAKRTACSGWFEATVVRGTDGHGRTKVRIDGYRQDCWAFDIRPLRRPEDLADLPGAQSTEVSVP